MAANCQPETKGKKSICFKGPKVLQEEIAKEISSLIIDTATFAAAEGRLCHRIYFSSASRREIAKIHVEMTVLQKECTQCKLHPSTLYIVDK